MGGDVLKERFYRLSMGLIFFSEMFSYLCQLKL